MPGAVTGEAGDEEGPVERGTVPELALVMLLDEGEYG